VDIEGELVEVIKPSSEINSGSLSKMGFTKIGGRWKSKDGDYVGPSGTNEGNENEEAAMQVDLAVGTQERMHHDINMEERMPNMSSFEMQMLNRMEPLPIIKGTSMRCANQGLQTWTQGSLLWMNRLKKFRGRFWNYNFKGRIALPFGLKVFRFLLCCF